MNADNECSDELVETFSKKPLPDTMPFVNTEYDCISKIMQEKNQSLRDAYLIYNAGLNLQKTYIQNNTEDMVSNLATDIRLSLFVCFLKIWHSIS